MDSGVVSNSSTLSTRIAPPEGLQRHAAAEGSFAHWLRQLPLRPRDRKVLLYDGREKGNQAAHVAVVDLDVGTRDLQQCADAAMRLRAEFLWSRGRADELCLHLTNGLAVPWQRWRRGDRPRLDERPGARAPTWAAKARADPSYAGFRRYLDFVFTYAGSASLARYDVVPVAERDLEPGDLFLVGGHPGHAVMVVDAAVDAEGRKRFLLAQSYMPAQDIHVLANPASPGSPWYQVPTDAPLVTPEWTFPPGAARRFSTRSRDCP